MALTEPQIVFLSEFLTARCADKLLSYWGPALKEEPSSVLKKFVECGLLVRPPLARRLGIIYTVADLKMLLKERGLPVSGAKQILVDRLMSADISGMESMEESVFECSDIAKSYIAKQEEERSMMISEVITLTRVRKVEQAQNVLTNFNKTHTSIQELKQLRYSPNPLAIEAPPDYYFRLISSILNARPQILKDVSDNDLERLRIAVAMWQLGGFALNGMNIAMEGYRGTSRFSPQTAQYMMLFYAKYTIQMEDLRKLGVKQCKILYGRKYDCKTGQSLDGRVIPLDEMPELPHPDCTEQQGCSCIATAVIPGFN